MVSSIRESVSSKTNDIGIPVHTWFSDFSVLSYFTHHFQFGFVRSNRGGLETMASVTPFPLPKNYRVLKGPGVFKGRG